jgi:N-acetylglucosaminyldiphosphoundecaprenol N-acetyl-beta-D-mannosaminyltransferase
MVFADGIGVVKALHWLTGEKIARLSFDATSLYRPFMQELCRHRKSLFIIGGMPGVAAKAAERIRRDFPALTVKGILSGFEDRDDAIAQILESDADAVLCGMGVPHQERFICQLKDLGFRGIAITCGGFLDQLIRAETYYPELVDRLELRWLYRLSKEPVRLGKRYLIDYWTFTGAVLGCLPGRLLRGRSMMPEAVSYRARTADDRPAE